MSSNEVEHNIKFDKNSNPFKINNSNGSLPKVAQLSNISLSNNNNNLQSTVPKYDNIFSKNNKAKIPRLKPPYRKRDLDRFEDCFRSDGTVRNGVTKKWNFILGAHSTVSLDVNKEYQDDDQRAQAFQQVVTYEPYKKAMDKANEILRKVNFRKVIHAAGIQASIYGRACIEKVRNPTDNSIVRLNVVNSKLLGDIEVDPDSWEFLGVHYRDLPKQDDLLEAQDIIYISRNDYHVSPGSMYYGLSDLEPVIDGSETKRIIKQEDLKEIARALWAGFGVIKFLDPNVTQEQMQEILNTIKAGAWTGTDHQVEITVQEIAQNSPMLLEIINEMNLETLRDLGVPSPTVGYENKQNYSNLVQTLIAWKESDLNAERRWLKDLIESQFLKEIFKQELEKQGIQCPENDEEDLIVDKPSYVPNDQPLNPLQPNGLAINITQVIPPAKLTIDIQDPDFTPYKEKMEMDLTLYDKQLISARKILERAGMEDQIEETEQRLRNNELKQEAMFGMQQKVFENQVMQTDELTMKKKNILETLEGKVSELTNGNSNNGNGAAAAAAAAISGNKPKNPFPPKNKMY
jgi:hypothetical protein